MQSILLSDTPISLYGITIRENIYATHLKRPESLQNKAFEVIAGGKNPDDATAYCKHFTKPNFKALRSLHAGSG